jgi:hypothetical protein
VGRGIYYLHASAEADAKAHAENEHLHATHRAKEETEYCFAELNYSRKGKGLENGGILANAVTRGWVK